MEKSLIHTDQTLEFACVVKTICDEYDIHPEDLRNFPPADNVLSLSNHVRFKKRIIIKIPLPSILAPKKLSTDPHLALARLRTVAPDIFSTSLTNDNSQLGRLNTGLGEFELIKGDKKIRFWVWNGAQDYYMFGGQSTYFIHRDDVLALTFYIKRAARKNRRPADMPILPSEMIREIYNNSVGFLLKGRDMQDKYKKYRIPYKRGILLSGRPGCVTGDTKIRIRKMQIGETAEIQMSDFFELVEEDRGAYEVETPQEWIEIGDMKREQKECFLLRTAGGLSLGAGHDHLVETQNGWEKVEDLDVQNTIIHTQSGDDSLVAREYIGIQDTFDFEVLSEEHKYYANGVISHNCGKTMSCRWLRELCEQNNLAYRVVTMEDYREAAHHGRVRGLFKLRGKRSGIIFFDDMDVMVADRKKGGGEELSTFLSELDGLDPADGVVYVFTTNYLKDLDEAFVRPGRIDLWLPFQLPTAKLRKKFIDQRFNEEIKISVDSGDVLERTTDYSFAELEEIRKLFCMELIDEKPINVDAIFKTFDKHRKDFEERAIMGFGTLDDDNDEDYGDEPEVYPAITY